MSPGRGEKSKIPIPKVLEHVRPSSAKPRTCSDRIIQLSLPNLHIVSSVLKDHFKTLSREHVDRLKNLLDQIKTSKVSLSQINFIEDFKDFKESDKRKLIELLDEVHTKEFVQQNQSEWTKIRLLPVKSSSDTFLIGLEKKVNLFGSCNNFYRSDRSSTDSSSNIGTHKGVFKKAVESMNFNYRETLHIKLEGVKNIVEQNSKFVQTEDSKSEICQDCKKEKQDVKVLYKNNSQKKSKPRQLYTLLENNEFLRNNINREYNTMKYDKYIQASQDTLFAAEDIQLAIQYLRNFYNTIITNINYLRNISPLYNYYLWKVLHETVFYSTILFTFLLYYVDKLKNSMLKSVLRVLNYIKTKDIRLRNQNYEITEKEHRKRTKKRKHVFTGFQFSNVPSIVH